MNIVNLKSTHFNRVVMIYYKIDISANYIH